MWRTMTCSAAAAALLGALVGTAAADDIYRWTDRQGGVHYSNTPTAGVPAGVVADPVESAVAVRDPDEPVAGGGEESPTLSPEASAEAAAGGEGIPGEATAAVPLSDDERESFSVTASLRRRELERDLRGTDKRLRELDDRLAGLAKARTRNQGGLASTGGVATAAGAFLSDEERALAGEREELAKHAAEVRGEGVKLRDEVASRLGGTPDWWVDLR